VEIPALLQAAPKLRRALAQRTEVGERLPMAEMKQEALLDQRSMSPVLVSPF